MKLGSFGACSIQTFCKILKNDNNIRDFITLSLFTGFTGDLVTQLDGVTLEI